MNNGNNNSKYFTVRGLKLLDELKNIETELNSRTIADNNNNKTKERALLTGILSNVTRIVDQVSDIKKDFEEKLLAIHGNNSNFLSDSILPRIMEMDKYLTELRNKKKAENQERQKLEANKRRIEEEERRKKQEIANLRNANLANQVTGIRSKINELRNNIGTSNNKYTNTAPVNIFANNTSSTNNTGARLKNEINKISTTNNKNGLLAIKNKILSLPNNQRYTLARQNGLNRLNNKLARINVVSHPLGNNKFNTLNGIQSLISATKNKASLNALYNKIQRSNALNSTKRNNVLQQINAKRRNPLIGFGGRIRNATTLVNLNQIQTNLNGINGINNNARRNIKNKINEKKRTLI